MPFLLAWAMGGFLRIAFYGRLLEALDGPFGSSSLSVFRGAARIDPIRRSSDFSACGNGVRFMGGVEDFEGRAEKRKESEDAPPSARVRSVAIVHRCR